MANKKQFVLDGAIVRCSNGASPSKLKVTTNHSVYADGKKVATKMDVLFTPPTFGICTPFSGTPAAPCVCTPVPPWSKPHNKQKFIGFQPLLGDSTLKCGRPTPKGFGKITIEYNMQFLASKYNIDPEKLLCPKCGDPLSNKKHECDVIPPGDYEGNGGTLGDGILRRKDKSVLHYGGEFSNHPFYQKTGETKKQNPRNGIEAHHLLSSSSVRHVEKYAALIRMLGYSINHRKNGVLLPALMQTACAYGVPLHNGGHGATFILNKDKDIDKDLKDIKKWEFEIPATKDNLVAVYPSYNILDEIAKLNYEDHINKIVKTICESYIMEDICNVEELFNIAKDFIVAMDKRSQVVFKKISTFEWTLTSDGFDYAPGGIGCCGCTTQKAKRKKIKDTLTDVELPSDKNNVKGFWTTILSDPDIVEKINEKKSDLCTAADRTKHPSKNGTGYFGERIGLKDFEKFKGQQ